MKDLIIVESPAKARTIKNFLGSGYEVVASKGHIRDLPKFRFGIKIQDQEKRFEPEYEISKEQKERVEAIKKYAKAKDVRKIYIATDEDREGEAIGYHITQALEMNADDFPRIVFHEVTKLAIQEALKSPRKIDIDKVNAQQARRLLDRIVGFKLSSLVSSKILKGLSAGRVQSAALKIIIDREREIRNFKPIDFYTIEGVFCGITASLVSFRGKKIKEQEILDSADAKDKVEILKQDEYQIGQMEKKNKKISSPPPFMTSTMQQSASSTLSYSPSRTMSIAQRLYEGVQTHEGYMGVITYMRTDSLNISAESLQSVREKIKNTFGKEYLPTKPKIYSVKNKSAQEAHECIRPTNLNFTPETAKSYLTPEELKLYTLIYNRFLASQMADALLETQSILFKGKNGEFKSNGKRLVFDGFYRVISPEATDNLLPNLQANTLIKPEKIDSIKHTTQPPPRFSEATLIKNLETLGIGRPSTYAPTITILSARKYIFIQKRQIVPEENSFKVIEMLEKYFGTIVDLTFSASLEDKLDEIAESKLSWQEFLWDFYVPFEKKVSEGKISIPSQKVSTPTGEYCPECGSELIQRASKYGEFVACSGYPKCKYKKSTKPKQDPYLQDIPCPKCANPIVIRVSKRGKFYGCSGYPKCKFTSNHKPTNKKCSECGSLMFEVDTKDQGYIYQCMNTKCKNKEVSDV